MRNFTVLLATGALTGTLFLAGCQPPDEDDAKKAADDEETVPHPPIEESRPGEETGAEQTGGPADGSEEEAGGGYESAQQPDAAATGEDAATFTDTRFALRWTTRNPCNRCPLKTARPGTRRNGTPSPTAGRAGAC